VLGGIVADRLSARDLRWGVWLVGIGTVALCPAYLLVLVAPTGSLAIAAYFIPAIFGVFYQGPTAALSQAVSPLSMRATSGALLLLIRNIIGLGFGPLAIGVLSDLLEPTFGADSLRYALLLAPIAAVIGAVFYFRAAKTLQADIQRAERLR
jgi:MFS family permease